MTWELDDIKKKLAKNSDLDLDLAASDPRVGRALGGRPSSGAGKKTAARQPGPESHLEEVLAHQLKALGAIRPAFQFRFDPDRRWRFDLAWPEVRLAVEVNGGIYGVGEACPACGRRASGGHHSIQGYGSDRRKVNQAQLAGWIVLEFTPPQVTSGGAAAVVIQALAQRRGAA